MWTQRDQLQAYQFLRRRLVSALQMGDANHPVSPSRRVIAGTALGLVCALLVTAGFAIFGVLRPGANQDWKKPGTVVIERESGASYVLDKDGRLHPVINYASARLLAGGEGTATVTVSARSLASVARGAPLGIVGAPTSLPAANQLTTAPWTVCAETLPSRPTSAPPPTTVTLGVAPTGAALSQHDALLVQDDTEARYAVIGGHRLRLRDEPTTVALGYDTATVVRVSTAWINAVPAGPDLALTRVAGVGGDGPRVGAESTKIGEVLVTADLGGTEHYYVVQSDGLAAITQTEAALILGNPADRAAYPQGPPKPVSVSAAEIGDAGPVHPAPADSGYPAVVPRPISVTGEQIAVCAVTDSSPQLKIWVSAAVPMPNGGKRIPVNGRSDARVADQTFVPPGRGALVREQQGTGVAIGTVYLVTDQGIRYPVNGSEAVKALGYGAVTPVLVAGTILALFPVGPVLDIAAAGEVAPTDSAGATP